MHCNVHLERTPLNKILHIIEYHVANMKINTSLKTMYEGSQDRLH
jgi:hypothetical protein